MREIIVKPFFGEGEPRRAWVVDDNYAITSDGLYIHILEYEMVGSDGSYKAKQPYNFIPVAIDEFRTVSGLNHYIQTLKNMTAWELLTEHYNIIESTFYVNRPKDYSVGYEEDGQAPEFGE